jgi:transposase
MIGVLARRPVMKVSWRDASDERRLVELVAATASAKHRDRYRVVLIAGRGLGDRTELEREQIAAAVWRSRQFVDEWVGRYRKGGINALVPKRQPGARRRLDAEQESQLCAMLEAGPPPEERIEQRFGKVYSLAGIYKLLHRLGYNHLMPRPRSTTARTCLIWTGGSNRSISTGGSLLGRCRFDPSADALCGPVSCRSRQSPSSSGGSIRRARLGCVSGKKVVGKSSVGGLERGSDPPWAGGDQPERRSSS